MSKEILTLNSQTVIGMVHCLPLPTTAGFDGDYQRIIDRAVQDAVTLEKAGVDAVIVENMGDTPFSAFFEQGTGSCPYSCCICCKTGSSDSGRT